LRPDTEKQRGQDKYRQESPPTIPRPPEPAAFRMCSAISLQDKLSLAHKGSERALLLPCGIRRVSNFARSELCQALLPECVEVVFSEVAPPSLPSLQWAQTLREGAQGNHPHKSVLPSIQDNHPTQTPHIGPYVARMCPNFPACPSIPVMIRDTLSS
jgi:hypothetical protein